MLKWGQVSNGMKINNQIFKLNLTFMFLVCAPLQLWRLIYEAGVQKRSTSVYTVSQAKPSVHLLHVVFFSSSLLSLGVFLLQCLRGLPRLFSFHSEWVAASTPPDPQPNFCWCQHLATDWSVQFSNKAQAVAPRGGAYPLNSLKGQYTNSATGTVYGHTYISFLLFLLQKCFSFSFVNHMHCSFSISLFVWIAAACCIRKMNPL